MFTKIQFFKVPREFPAGAPSLIKYFIEDSYKDITGINFTEDHVDDMSHWHHTLRYKPVFC